MNIEKVFRWVVAISLFSLVPVIWIDYAALVDLSGTNLDYEYLISLSDGYMDVIFDGNFLALLLFLFLSLASYFLIFFYIKYSRELFIFLTVIGFSLEIFGGVVGSFTFASVLEGVFVSVGVMADGALIAIMCLTPLKEKFDRA